MSEIGRYVCVNTTDMILVCVECLSYPSLAIRTYEDKWGNSHYYLINGRPFVKTVRNIGENQSQTSYPIVRNILYVIF